MVHWKADSVSVLFRSAARKIGANRIDEKTVFHRAPAEKHSEFHVVPVGKAEVDIPGVITQRHGNMNEGADLFMAAGISHRFVRRDGPVTVDHPFHGILIGVHLKFHAFFARFGRVELKSGGVQARRSCARVDFCLNVRNA